VKFTGFSPWSCCIGFSWMRIEDTQPLQAVRTKHRMSPSLASLVCACGIAALFFLDRDNSVHTSKGLWLPVAWIWIVGSRPVSSWLGVVPSNEANVQLEGSPIDSAVFGALLVAAIVVLIFRGSRTRTFLTANGPILIYFLYCLVSVLWSDFPDVSFKRWIKAIGDLAMVLIVATEVDPAAALGRLFSRTGFILLPTSVLFIKYYVNLGRGYTPDGDAMNTGVAVSKNMLGVMLLVISLGVVWRVLTLLRDKGQPSRGRHLLSQGALLVFGVALLKMADSATSLFCFILGTTLLLATGLPAIRSRPVRVHLLVAAIVLAAALVMLTGGKASVTHALGRQSDFTGRTDIWAAVISVAPNAILGTGFESFWLGPRLQRVWSLLSSFNHVTEAHNGYLEVYLNLGLIGVGMIAAILVSGYRRAVASFRREPALGSLMLAYVAAAAVYSVSEAGFRLLDPIWIFLLLAVVASSGITSDVRSVEPVSDLPDLRNSRIGRQQHFGLTGSRMMKR
jgi:exopolysaccharide production protein ExoQ